MEGAALEWLASLKNPLFSFLGLAVICLAAWVVRLSRQIDQLNARYIEDLSKMIMTQERYKASLDRCTEIIAALKDALNLDRRR